MYCVAQAEQAACEARTEEDGVGTERACCHYD